MRDRRGGGVGVILCNTDVCFVFTTRVCFFNTRNFLKKVITLEPVNLKCNDSI